MWFCFLVAFLEVVLFGLCVVGQKTNEWVWRCMFLGAVLEEDGLKIVGLAGGVCGLMELLGLLFSEFCNAFTKFMVWRFSNINVNFRTL